MFCFSFVNNLDTFYMNLRYFNWLSTLILFTKGFRRPKFRSMLRTSQVFVEAPVVYVTLWRVLFSVVKTWNKILAWAWNWDFLWVNSWIQWTWNTMRLLGSTIHMFLLRDNIQEIRKEPRMCTDENKLLWFKWYIGEIGKSFSIELKFVNCSEI